MNNFLRHLRFALIPRGPILDIGSGGAPFWRANILLERYIDDDGQRPGSLIKDRPMVCGDIHAIPFMDKSFAFVHCSHILEHVDDPELAIKEIMRVSNAGYIETPSPLQELVLLNFPFHRWFVSIEANVLVFREKPQKIDNNLLGSMKGLGLDSKNFNLKEFEGILFIKYFWKEKIDFRVVKNSTPIEPFRMETEDNLDGHKGEQAQSRVKGFFKDILKTIYQYNFNFFDLVICPKCKKKVYIDQNEITCENCSLSYPIANNIPIMIIEKAKPISSSFRVISRQ